VLAGPRLATEERADWNEAARVDRIEAYEGFLNAWPSGAHSEDARARLDYLWNTDEGAWIRAQRLDSIGGYADFLRAYPRSPFAADARRRLDEYRRQDDWAWDSARPR
jgi:outer membrane protein assembly factor BamD (BamD/ComL family)